jgi:hypothetical protein
VKTTKKILSVLFAIILVFAACKKDKVLQPQKEEIVLANLSAWSVYVPFSIVKTETILSDADYERIKNAVGLVEIKMKINDNMELLPYSTIKNDFATVYYYQWDVKKLTIYKQMNKVVFGPPDEPATVQLGFYVLK